jgi:hypothetical protein
LLTAHMGTTPSSVENWNSVRSPMCWTPRRRPPPICAGGQARAARRSGSRPAAEGSLQPGTLIAVEPCAGGRAGRRFRADLAGGHPRGDDVTVPHAQSPPGERQATQRGEPRRAGDPVVLADLRVAQGQGAAGEVLALEPAPGHTDRGSGPVGEDALARSSMATASSRTPWGSITSRAAATVGSITTSPSCRSHTHS